MKMLSTKLLLACTLAFTIHTSVFAAELDCEDLSEVMKGMEMIATFLHNSNDLSDEDSDKLGELIAALQVIAKTENYENLTHAVNEMDRIWHDDTTPWEDDLPNFRMAMDSVIMNVERLHDRDCK
jgi:hypothetical protein